MGKGFTSREKLEDVIQQIVGRCNRVINESMPICDATSGEWCQSKCSDSSGCPGRTDSYNTKVSGYTYHNGEADRAWQSSAGMCTVSGNTCKSKIFDGYRQEEPAVGKLHFWEHCPITFQKMRD